MTLADIEVKFVNPPKPGKKLGSIKTADDGFWLVPPTLLNQLSPGMKCRIEYDESKPWEPEPGKQIFTVAKIIVGQTTQVPKNSYRQRSNPTEARQIAVLALLKEWMGKVPVGDVEAARHAIDTMCDAYDRSKLAGGQAQQRDDMDDNIPY